MRVLDLFSGIGGFSLGLERAGMRTVAFCEIDSFCRRVLAKHWPGVPCADDIISREFVEGEADVVCGGFPCQDISYAGEGAGLSGPRSGLWREMVRAFRVVRPRHAVVENVAALLNRGMGDVLGDLAEIGFDAEWHCIPASAAGAPHRRDRVWIIADARSEQHEGDRAPYSGEIAAQLSRTLTDASPVFGTEVIGREPDGDHARAGEVADTFGQRELQQEGCEQAQRRRPGHGCGEMADAARCGRSERPADAGRRREGDGANEWAGLAGGGWWLVEPDVGRVAHGIPSRVDRLRSLGNAVVPQIPEIIGRAIMKVAHNLP